MISVSEKISSLKQREQQLHTSLDNLRGQRTKVKEHKQLDKELTQIIRKRQNLESLARFEVGMPVHRADSRSLGKVTEIVITPGGLAEVWVSWDGKVQIPEQPDLLEPDAEALAQIIQVGDHIIIGKRHAARGKTFTVAKLLARGWVESTDEDVFPREYWTKVESLAPKAVNEQEESMNEDDATPVTTAKPEMVEQTPPQEELETQAEAVVTVEIAINTQETSELSEDEEKERHRLESKVERAFYEAGTALRELRDKRLYRSTHKTFEDYCRERFAFTRMAAHFKIAAAMIWENLYTNGIQTLPSSERQVRELATIEPEQQPLVWRQAVEQANGKIPSGRIVKGIVERLKEKPLTLASDFCSLGDVFTLTRLEGVERKYNGCWAIANDLREFTVVVDVYDATLTVKSENLQPIDLPDAHRQLPAILKRIRRLRSSDALDRCACTVLESLGKQTYLTDFEDKLLTFMEQEYGIIDNC